jgi:hypothetical protein
MSAVTGLPMRLSLFARLTDSRKKAQRVQK